MKNPLNKSLKREFKTNMARYLSIAIVMIVMIGAVSGFLTVAYGSKYLLEENQVACKVEDGQFAITTPLRKQSIEALNKRSLSVYDLSYSEQDIREGTMIRSYRNRTDVNLPTLSEGTLPENRYEIALDRLFAVKNDFKVNDYIQLGTVEFKITGLISVPDYTSLIKKNSDFMMDPIHFGIGIVDDQGFDKLAQTHIVYNYSYYLKDRNLSDANKYDKLNEIKDVLLQQGYTIENIMSAQMNQAISFLPNDMGSDIPMIQTLLYIILVILAFIFVVISQAIIEEQSTVIGTLLASGYTKYELIAHYMILPACIIFISSIIGNILGYTLFPPLFSMMYYGSYCLPPFEIRFIPEAFLSTTVIPFIFMMSIQYLKLLHIMRISPLRFLRRDLRKQRKSRYIHLKNSAFFQRFRIRVILQNKGSYITLFLGIMFASFLFLFGMVMTPTLHHYIQESEKSVKAEYQYILKAPIEADGEKITLTSLQAHYAAGDLDLDVSFYGLRDTSAFYTDIELPKGSYEIVISSDFADKMSLAKGDTLLFKNPNTEKEYTFTVSAIYEYRAGFSAYMKQDTLNKLLNQDNTYYNGYLSNQKLKIDDRYIQNTITKHDIVKIGEQATQVFSQMIPIMVSVALIIYFVVMYILTKLVIDRNSNHMSFLKVIGYNNKEIKSLYMHATTYVVIGSLFVSLPICGIGLHYLMLFAFMSFSSYIEAYIPQYMYVLVFITGYCTYILISFILTKRISHINLGSSLKETE